MITDSNKLALLNQIAKLFFPSDLIGQGSAFIRMKTNLDNDSFDYFISNLTQGRYYIFEITKVVHQTTRTGVITIIENRFTDLITGAKGTGGFTIPTTLYANGKWNEIFSRNNPPMILLRDYLINNLSGFLVYSPQSTSYNVAYVPADPTGGGSGSGSGSGSYTGGTVIVKQPVVNQPNPVMAPVENIGSLDFSKMILPLVAIAGVYFFMK